MGIELVVYRLSLWAPKAKAECPRLRTREQPVAQCCKTPEPALSPQVARLCLSTQNLARLPQAPSLPLPSRLYPLKVPPVPFLQSLRQFNPITQQVISSLMNRPFSTPPSNLLWGNFLILFDKTVCSWWGLKVIFNLNRTQGNDAIISLSWLNGSSFWVFELTWSWTFRCFWPLWVLSKSQNKVHRFQRKGLASSDCFLNDWHSCRL